MKPKKPFYKRAWFIIIIIIIILIIIGVAAGGGDPQTSDSTSAQATPDVATTTEPQPTFEFTRDLSEDGRVFLDYSLTGDYDYFKATDSKNQRLAESIYDDALAFMEKNYPDATYLNVSVTAQNGADFAFFIDRPNEIVTPKVQFQKYKAGTGAIYDYDWYDNRYGNGQEWDNSLKDQ